MKQRRPLALGAAAALGLGSLFIAGPALAEDAGATAPDLTAQAFADAATLESTTGLDDLTLGAATTTSGEAIVFVDEAVANDPANQEKLDEAAGKVGSKIAVIGQPVADSADEVVGGAGYFGLKNPSTTSGGLCSVGFSGFDSAGDPAIITAGHCASSGAITDVSLTRPSAEPAGGGDPEAPVELGADLGTFGFYQFGGPGSTPGADNDPSSTDIAVIDVTNDALTLLPEVTDWSASASGSDDLASSIATEIRGVSLPKSGTVSKSGRTTGLTEGNTKLRLPVRYEDGSTGVEEIEILDGYMQIADHDGNPFWVHGFLGGALTEGGDSGGAVFQGDQAVGVVSGGPDTVPEGTDDWAWYTLLEPALQRTDGYEVAIAIDTPTVANVSDGDTVGAGDSLEFEVPGNAEQLVVSFDGGEQESFDVTSGENVSVPVPDGLGAHSATFKAVSGHSASENGSIDFTVAPARPTIKGATLTAGEGEDAVTTDITGTGIAGAAVKVNDIWDATVDEDGNWKIADVSLGIGKNELTAVQTSDGATSAKGTATITVKPATPGVVSIEPGQTFEPEDAPTSISGTGLEGADIELTINGQKITDGQTPTAGDPAPTAGAPTVGADGSWSVEFGAALDAGTYSVSVQQSFNSVASDATSFVFTVAAAPNPGANSDADAGGAGASADANGGSDAGSSADASAGANGSSDANGGGQLPTTGAAAANMLPMGLAAGAMLLLGVGAIVLTARRMRAEAEEA